MTLYPKIIQRKTLANLLDVSVTKLDLLRKTRDFPEPKKIDGTLFWQTAQIDRWITLNFTNAPESYNLPETGAYDRFEAGLQKLEKAKEKTSGQST